MAASDLLVIARCRNARVACPQAAELPRVGHRPSQLQRLLVQLTRFCEIPFTKGVVCAALQEKTVLFWSDSLCLSRACLGKINI
jgi:hypothetical protein